MSWFLANLPYIGQLTALHLAQSVIPVVVGFALALPLARLALGRRADGRSTEAYTTAGQVRKGAVVNGAALLYTVPSLALFVLMPLVLGTSITSPLNVYVALTIYVVAMMVRSAVDAFESVSPITLEAATAVGYTPLRRFWQVELPLSLPVMIAGLRVALVSNISMVSVGAVIGIQSLGTLFTDGLRRDIPAEIITGILLTLVLALVLDRLLALVGATLTRWRNP
ncbi:ABC transporter permease subunit [Rothia sp. SD9660Na]|uniref:ABC transporter permease n=1 Tax=Rothia sp. SD9660Na TaxID=3047030 RepID=UPI0024BB3BDC|nr:ABC transporter permease subunit [Rothia sp. SD9660Na]WHS50583.1 ABC transporter permease subunit [Rothia sp. SD9660Na]